MNTLHSNGDIIRSFYDYITHNSPDNVDDVLDFVSDLTDMSPDYILSEIDKIDEIEMG
jgi:hypothetical protein